MTDKLTTGIVSVFVAIIAVAIIAVLVSQQSNTAGVLKAGGGAFSGIIKAAVSPVSGGGGFGGSSFGTIDFSNFGFGG